MGRHSSDSEKDRKKIKKKKKKRSRTRSRSSEKVYSSKPKKSKKSKKKHKSRSRSRSVDSYGRTRSRSRGRRSRSFDRYRSRSRSRSRSKYSRRSRSLSRGRYERSLSRGRYERSRSRDQRRRRSRSYDRFSRRSRSRSSSRRDRGKTSEERADPCLLIPGFSELPPSEQAKIRMQMALKAAAAADEKIKADNTPYQGPSNLKDQLIFNKALQDIESSGFKVHNFKSNQREKKEPKTNFNEEFTFGTAGEIRLDSNQRNPVLINVDTDELADPSLYVDPEVKMDKWIQKLSAMRRKKLEGEVLS